MHRPTDTPRLIRASAALAIALAGSVAVLLSQSGISETLTPPHALRLQWRVWLRPGLGRPWDGPWQLPAESLLALAGGAAVLIAIAGIGLVILDALNRKRLPFSAAESLALAPLVGAVPVSLTTLGLGLAGCATCPAMSALLACLVLVSLAGWRRRLRRRGNRPKQKWGAIGLVSLAAIVIVFALAIPYALSPVVQSDALRYHVAAPAQWLREGRIQYLPHQAFSNFPFLGEMLFMLAMAPGGYAAAQVVHLGMLLVCLGLIFLTALRWMGWSGTGKARGQALAAAAGFATIPSVAIIAGWAFIDLFMAAYFLGFTLVGAAALARPGRRRDAVLGFMIAGALSVKYSMLPLMGLLGVAWFVLSFQLKAKSGRSADSQSSFRSGFRSALLVAFVGLALASPWYIRNAAWTGDPFYPLAIGHFPSADWSAENERFYLAKAGEKGFKIEGLARPAAAALELLITPYTVTYRSDLFEGHVIGPLPLIGLLIGLAGLMARTRHPGLKPRLFLMTCLTASWIFWFATYQATRMLFPTIGLVLAWAATAAAGIERRLGLWAACGLRAVVGAALLLALTIDIMLLIIPNGRGTANADAIATGLGFERREAYLARSVGYWQMARQLGRTVAPGETALLIGEHRPLYFDMPIVASDFFDTPQPVPWFRRTSDNGAMLDRLLADGVHYIFYNQDELNKYYSSYFVTRLNPGEVKRFEALLPISDRTDHDPRLQEIESRGAAPHRIVIYRILP